MTSYKLAAKIALESRIARNSTPNQSSVDSTSNQSSVNSSDDINKKSYCGSSSRPTQNWNNKEKETKIPKWFKKNK